MMKIREFMIVGWMLHMGFDKAMLAEGHMLNLARLMSEGTSGKFQSVFPPITHQPGLLHDREESRKHGIFHFMEAKPGSYALGYTNASSRRTRTVGRFSMTRAFTTGITISLYLPARTF